MSRSFRYSDQFEDKRQAFAARKVEREARRRIIDAPGSDEPEWINDVRADQRDALAGEA